MGEFDLSLINEYRNRPSFYDRNAPRFKDKLYNAHLWQEISNKLGFDVSILKDRILQLRNRYNLEKRRIEQLKEEHPNKEFDSPWPLYDHLHFLSDHIRARRSYKKMMPLNGGGDMTSGPYVAAPDLSNSGSNNSNLTSRHIVNESAGSGATVNDQNVTAFPNGLLAVKMEDGTETEEETESQNNDSEINAFDTTGLIPETHSSSLPVQQQQQRHQQQHSSSKQYHQQQHQQTRQQQPPTISIRRLDTLKQDYNDSSSSIYTNKRLLLQQQYQQRIQQQQQHQQLLQLRNNHRAANRNNQSLSQLNDDDSNISATPAKQPRLSPREFKYKAFGNFISSSLLDLPASAALELVEKFTSDIVKVLIGNAQQGQDQEQLQQQQRRHQQQQQQEQNNDSEN